MRRDVRVDAAEQIPKFGEHLLNLNISRGTVVHMATCRICGRVKTDLPKRWIAWECPQCFYALLKNLDGTILPGQRYQALHNSSADTMLASSAKLLISGVKL